ncbi:MAG TPA: Ig-like domain-containing protein [Spirochaetota bacterium]|nr:Ig-like domain-containing protein [Spirochaetota bacterium]HPI88660.1 Ig-like domain-containing protein [Spirochaetota bacterium]HPR49101.1 Ig-like domain-containing protein [Spirochaetota bacterium]
MKHNLIKIAILFIATLLIQQLLQHETKACNVAVVSASASATGRPFIWKNRDHAESYRQEVLYYPEVVSGVGGSLRLMGETTFDSGVSVCTGGANESGFAIANTTCWESLLLEAANVNTELMEVVLEECKTLTEFEQVVSEFTDRWSNKNISGIFAVIDAYNGAAIYEMWSDGNGNDVMYRKYNVDTGTVTDEDGHTATDCLYEQTVGFNNRTNSNHTDGWISIWTDTPRELRARQVFTEMQLNDELTPRNLMREVSKDVCGGNPADYCSTESKVMNSWDGDNDDNDSYLNPNRDGEMYTRYCISRYQTTMGLVIEGAADPDEANLTTMWVSLGEPSLSVFVPFFPYAEEVSKYAYHDEHSNSGYYWNGTSDTENNGDNSFLNLLFDCVEANPFSSGDSLYSTYNALALYKNNGSGTYVDSQDRNDGEYYGWFIYYKMDTTINYPRLLSLQNWTFPLEDNVYDRVDEYLSVLRANPSLIDREGLGELSDYSNKYVYVNYSNQSDSYMLWDLEIPDDGQNPTISSVNTGDGTDFPVDGSISVQFSEPMNESSINDSTFTVSTGSTYIEGEVVYDSSTHTATFYPSSDLACGTTYTVTLTDDIEDLSGRTIDGVYSWTFTTVECGSSDTTPPTVILISPIDGSTGFAISGNITARFSEAMDPSSIDEDSFEVFRGSSSVSGTVTYNSSTRTATFNPDIDLAEGTEYTVELASSMTDVAGNGIVGGFSWTFTTATGGTTGGDAPTVAAVSPADESTGFSVSGVITARFSEAMDESSIDEDTFELFTDGKNVSGSISYNSSTNTATFEPDSDLATGTLYKVELSSDITDEDGYGIAGGYSWTFTTSSSISTDPVLLKSSSSSSGGGDGCGTAAEASTLAGGTRPFLPGLISLMVTMIFPFSLTMLHRRARRRKRS